MYPEQENIFGNRLKLARKMAGMSLQDLSDKLVNLVTKQALNKYELGQMNPTSDVLIAIAKALGVNPDYFIKSSQIELGNIQFRKRASLTKKDEEAVVEKARDYFERYIDIENILSINSKFQNPIGKFVIRDKADVELAANELRKRWELGTTPIMNLVETLELKGIKVFLIEAVDEIDGFATFTSTGIPVVVVNINGRSTERIRFTIIHELAHLLLLFSESLNLTEKQVEAYCHFFASCFLLPSKMILKMLGEGKRTYIAIKELVAIKEYYGISIRAILHRLKELEIITTTYYEKWVVYLSKTYGSKKEPGEYKGEEKAKQFEQLINRALSEDLISLSKAASLSNISVNELRKGFIDAN